MASLPPQTGSSENPAERIRCLYCGANNFPNAPTCWQCSRPLRAAKSGPATAASPAPSVPSPGSPEPTEYARLAAQTDARFRSTNVNPATAGKAAAALGLMFPYIGLPVGIVFLMLDDARKVQLGWITIWWSVVGSVANGLLLVPLIMQLMGGLKGLIPHGQPGGGLPGLPNTESGGSGLEILFRSLLLLCFYP